MKRLNDYFNLTDGFLFSQFLAPVWVYAFPDTAELDLYFLTRYGQRNAFASCLDQFAGTDGTISGDNLKRLADLVYHVNARKWEHLFEVYNADYNPIENTDFVEEVTEDNQTLRTIDSDKSTTGSNTTDSSGTSSGSDSGNINRYGFNSSNAVGERTEGRTSSATTSNNVESEDSSTEEEDTSITNDEDKKLVRRKHGNIGVIDNATMLQKSVDFWKWSFIDAVCKDICEIIALSIY